MKTKVVILLILDVFKFIQTEFWHHPLERRAKENLTTLSRTSAKPLQKSSRETRVPELAVSSRQAWAVTVPDESETVPASYMFDEDFPRYTSFQSYPESNHNWNRLKLSRESAEGNEHDGREKFEKNQTEINFLMKKSLAKSRTPREKVSGTKNTKRKFGSERSKDLIFDSGEKNSPIILVDYVTDKILSTSNKLVRETSTESYIVDEKMYSRKENFAESSERHDEVGKSEKYKKLNLFDGIFNLHFAEPLVALPGADEIDGCTENIVDGFRVTDDLVADDVLVDRNQAEKLTMTLASDRRSLDTMTDAMESVMENHPRIISISVAVTKRGEQDSKMFQTVYRKDGSLLISRKIEKHLKFSVANEKSWTYLFKNCLTKTWIFGYYFYLENDYERVDTTVYFSVDHIKGTIDQCDSNFQQVLNGGPKCDVETSECMMIANSGFTLGGYKCVCREGFRLPENFLDSSQYMSGVEIEKLHSTGNFSHRCVPCSDSCPDSMCNMMGLCIFRRSNLLRTSILFIQVFCMLLTIALIFLVFKHRKCKTIASGMWTIMEMILLGCVILYGTIIIKAFNPSTIFCLIEPWCREIGFVLCYGAIILKLYRILIEFRTRKAHRWIIRDKDLLKYLLGMVIVVFGYMSAWTVMNLDLIQKDRFSMLTKGVTADGVPFNTCKPAWWDYVTQTSEILILVFGIHLSYASRNATTQFRERCFLCISISTEAFISGTFYLIRYFYWDETIHPDASFVADFTRCQLTTTVVLLLLFGPKWWYQKVLNSKGKVSRNYLMQESGRGPLEAFKPQDGVTATNSDVEGEITLADMNPEDIRAELKRLYTQLEVLKNKTIRFDNPHISKRRGGRKIAHRRFSLQTLRQQTQRLSARQAEPEVTEEVSRTPEDSIGSNEGPSIVINDGPSDATPCKG